MQLNGSMNRTFAAASLATALVVSAAALAAGEPESPPIPRQAAPGGQAPPIDREPLRDSAIDSEAAELELAKLRLREGARLRDVAGHFHRTGDSLTFIDGENREIGGLQNLNLERIIRMLKSVEEPESVTWSVSGVITEFSGRNYLLISRAVFKTASPPPAPESLVQQPPSPK